MRNKSAEAGRRQHMISVPLKVRIVLGAFLAVGIVFSLLNPAFISGGNILAILMRMAILVPIALGVMLSLAVKGIDLSAGTIVGLLGIILAMLIRGQVPLGLGIMVIAALGTVIGLINGILIGRLNMNPFIATLAMMFIGNSIERVLTQGGLPIYLYTDTSGLSQVFRTKSFGIPIPIILLGAVGITFYLLMDKSVFGRRLYAAGSSLGGAVNAGIPVRSFYTAAYTVSGLLASISALLVASQVRSGQPLVGQSYMWDAIGAGFLSTILSRYRRPNVTGTIFGVGFLAMITNGLTILGLEFYWMGFFRGIIILLILTASALTDKQAPFGVMRQGIRRIRTAE